MSSLLLLSRSILTFVCFLTVVVFILLTVKSPIVTPTKEKGVFVAESSSTFDDKAGGSVQLSKEGNDIGRSGIGRKESNDLIVSDPSAFHHNFFDCDASTSICTYFSPRDFMREGRGREFLDEYEKLGGKNNNLPAITSLSWWYSKNDEDDDDDDEEDNGKESIVSDFDYLPHNLSFVHMHKCGGTTIKATLYELSHQIKRSSVAYARVESYRYSFGGGSKKQKERNEQMRQAHVDAISDGQRNANANAFFKRIPLSSNERHRRRRRRRRDHFFPVFTVVRDPIDRFLSGLQQVMHYNDEFRSKCLHSTSSRKTIQCAIEDVAMTAYRHDVHLIPMVSHLRLLDATTKSAPILVSVFHLRDIDILLDYLFADDDDDDDGGPQTRNPEHAGRRRRRQAIMSQKKGKSHRHHLHDRSDVKFSTSPVLSAMSVEDCDDTMLEAICCLYAIDVAMLKDLGFPTPYCP